jgi:hypothetical protein
MTDSNLDAKTKALMEKIHEPILEFLREHTPDEFEALEETRRLVNMVRLGVTTIAQFSSYTPCAWDSISCPPDTL